MHSETLTLAAIQKTIQTNVIKAGIEKSLNNTKCRLCKVEETIDLYLVPERSLHSLIINLDIIKWLKLSIGIYAEMTSKQSIDGSISKKSEESEKVKILGDFQIHTDEVMVHNTPDIK